MSTYKNNATMKTWWSDRYKLTAPQNAELTLNSTTKQI